MNSLHLILKNKLRRKELDNLNYISLKIRPELKIENFLLQFYEFSVILWFNLYEILDFDRNNLCIHFCFSEFLILREKKVRGFFLGHWSTKKSYKFSKNIENTILQQAPQITLFFDSPCGKFYWEKEIFNDKLERKVWEYYIYYKLVWYLLTQATNVVQFLCHECSFHDPLNSKS